MPPHLHRKRCFSCAQRRKRCTNTYGQDGCPECVELNIECLRDVPLWAQIAEYLTAYRKARTLFTKNRRNKNPGMPRFTWSPTAIRSIIVEGISNSTNNTIGLSYHPHSFSSPTRQIPQPWEYVERSVINPSFSSSELSHWGAASSEIMLMNDSSTSALPSSVDNWDPHNGPHPGVFFPSGLDIQSWSAAIVGPAVSPTSAGLSQPDISGTAESNFWNDSPGLSSNFQWNLQPPSFPYVNFAGELDGEATLPVDQFGNSDFYALLEDDIINQAAVTLDFIYPYPEEYVDTSTVSLTTTPAIGDITGTSNSSSTQDDRIHFPLLL